MQFPYIDGGDSPNAFAMAMLSRKPMRGATRIPRPRFCKYKTCFNKIRYSKLSINYNKGVS